MIRFFMLIALALSLCGAFHAETQQECDKELADCVKANNCAKTPNSSECKACKAAFDKCSASAQQQRGTKKAPGRRP